MSTPKKNVLPDEEVDLGNEEVKPVEPETNLMNYNFPGLGSVKAANLEDAQKKAREKWPEYFANIEKEYEKRVKAKEEREAKREE